MSNINEKLRLIESKEGYLDLIYNSILEGKQRLLYLTKVGSHLYGTQTPDSDLDMKGIFVPSVDELILDDATHHYSYSSSGYNTANTEDDVDLELFSLHRFFDLLKKGDTNMYDILYSPTNENAVIKMSETFEEIFKNKGKLVAKKQLERSFIGYAYGQVRRYQQKGERYKRIKCVVELIRECNLETNLYELLDEIEDRCNVEFDIVDKNDDKYINMFGSSYPQNFGIEKVLESLEAKMEKYGSRVKNTDDIDYTSLYHAVRSVRCLIRLSLSGVLEYPLPENLTDNLLEIKDGKKDYKEVVNSLEGQIDYARDVLEHTDLISDELDTNFMDNLILKAVKH